MGFADDAVEVFQPGLVLDQNDQVVVFLFQHLFVAAQAGVDLLHRLDALLPQILQHFFKDAGQRHRVVHGAVVVEGRDLQVFVDGIQFVVAQPRIERLAHRQRIHIGVVKADACPGPRFADEQHVKAVGVVGHQGYGRRRIP